MYNVCIHVIMCVTISVPSAPWNVSAVPSTPNDVEVRWNIPKIPNGPLNEIIYSIKWTTINPDKTISSGSKRVGSVSSKRRANKYAKATVPKLKEAQKYRFKVGHPC